MKKNLALLTLIVSQSLTLTNLLAQDDDRVLRNDPIDIDGYVTEPKATDRELIQINSELGKQKDAIQVNKEKSKKYQELGKTTEKLADVTEEYIDSKKESEQIIEEYNKKIDCLTKENPSGECDKFTGGKKSKVEDKVVTRQAAPAAAVSEVEAETPSIFGDQKIKIAVQGGAANFSGQVESLETEYMLGLKIDADIANNFAVGLGVNYLQFETKDFGDNYLRGYDFFYDYRNLYGNDGRNIRYNQWIIDGHGKFILSSGNRFRPYVGGGLAYNRAKMDYTDNDSYDPFNYGYQRSYEFGGEEYITSWMSAQLAVGSEILFTNSFGMNIEAGYSKAIGSMFNRQRAITPADGLDQARLEELADDITKAHVFSFNIGLLMVF